jgi:hypothetical protein
MLGQQPKRPQVGALQLAPRLERLGSSSEVYRFRVQFREASLSPQELPL